MQARWERHLCWASSVLVNFKIVSTFWMLFKSNFIKDENSVAVLWVFGKNLQEHKFFLTAVRQGKKLSDWSVVWHSFFRHQMLHIYNYSRKILEKSSRTLHPILELVMYTGGRDLDSRRRNRSAAANMLINVRTWVQCRHLSSCDLVRHPEAVKLWPTLSSKDFTSRSYKVPAWLHGELLSPTLEVKSLPPNFN